MYKYQLKIYNDKKEVFNLAKFGINETLEELKNIVLVKVLKNCTSCQFKYKYDCLYVTIKYDKIRFGLLYDTYYKYKFILD